MTELIAVLKTLHVLNAILMAWPIYALVAVNQRARLGPPLGDRADLYLENVIRNRTIPCFVFQGTALVTGLLLILLQGLSLSVLVTNPILGLKLLLLLLIVVLLANVHVGIQPRINALFAEGGNPVPKELGAKIGALRLRRKRIASICMFVVLMVSMLGVQAWSPFPLWLTALFVLAIAGFTLRAYRSLTPYGWV
jgi:hypothetical protein